TARRLRAAAHDAGGARRGPRAGVEEGVSLQRDRAPPLDRAHVRAARHRRQPRLPLLRAPPAPLLQLRLAFVAAEDRMRLKLASLALCWLLADAPMDLVHQQIAAHPGQSGAYVLDTGDEALIARAWLGDHARTSIDAQYFIWSTDNIGILAAESLLRAAERGVR